MSIDWIEYSSAEKANYFRNYEKDCSFLVGMKDEEEPREFKSFKFVLSSISPVFQRMFNGDFKEAKSSEPIFITDIYASNFEAFLDFIYGTKPHITKWKKLYDIAKKYLADGIIDAIIAELNRIKKTPAEALQLFEIMSMENKDFVMRVEENGYMCNSNDAILLFEAIKTNCSFISNLSGEVFLELLNVSKDYVDVTPLFRIIVSYCFDNILGVDMLKLFLGEIDLSKMSHGDYIKYVETSEVLDIYTKHKILVDICRHHANMY